MTPIQRPAPRRIITTGRRAQLKTSTRPAPAPTDEQTAIVDTYLNGHHLVVEAGAGTGKTSTLRMIAHSRPTRPGLYIAYNRAIADEARTTFAGVECRTAHSLAYHAVGRLYEHRLTGLPGRRKGHTGGRRLPASEVARILKLHPITVATRHLTAPALARLADTTIVRFCQSADDEPNISHVPAVTGIDDPYSNQILAAHVLPAARTMWNDITDIDGHLYFTHDHYLKIWQLVGPVLPFDYVMLDEAQDANPVIAAIVDAQDHAQQIRVGDRSQAIYGWRGATDAMAGFDGQHHQLTQSFRFGHTIADEANAWLDMLDANLRLRGHQPIDSAIGYNPDARAVLCRTNGGAMSEIMDAFENGRHPHLVGGGDDIKRFAFAALSLMKNAGCDHPELAAFRTWSELCVYVDEEESGRDLRVLVNLVHRYGPSAVIDTCNRLVPENRADTVVSTAHKAKGLEWPSVRISTDFLPPEDGSPPDRAELMLAYVAVTRAQRHLDVGSLRWRHRQPADDALPPSQAA